MADVILVQRKDDRASIRDRLRRVRDGRVVLVLDWDIPFLSDPLDGELLRREADRLGLEVGVVSEDPERRALVRGFGLPVFASVAKAEAVALWRRPERPSIEPPAVAWWEEEVPISPPSAPIPPGWVRQARHGARLAVFAATLLLLVTFAYIIVPRATITLIPAGDTFAVIVPVSASMEVESVDVAAGLIPASRVGDWFEGDVEVETTGSVALQFGRASGNVLFTNLLGQDVLVPVGTVVRTSAGSFAIRFATTEEVLVPAFGQAPAPIEALNDGPVGNVRANQINQAEGAAALALRVTNPEPTYGGSTEQVRAVSQADKDRARAVLTERLMDEAYFGLQQYLEPTEVLPRQSLEIQASEIAYDRFLTERADTLGLRMRLLITGLRVDRDNAEAIAYSALGRLPPPAYGLTEADFLIGEAAEERMDGGEFTFFVTATGYAAARIDPAEARRSVLGSSVRHATERLAADVSLAEPPRIDVWPAWLGRVPVLPLRVDVRVVP